MSDTPEVAVAGCTYWFQHVTQLAQLLVNSRTTVIRDPSGAAATAPVYLTSPVGWTADPAALRDALRIAAAETPASVGEDSRLAPGIAGPAEERLVYTVEEAATLLGISRSFAYDAVNRGDIPSMRIGRRILVPKAALERFLEASGG